MMQILFNQKALSEGHTIGEVLLSQSKKEELNAK